MSRQLPNEKFPSLKHTRSLRYPARRIDRYNGGMAAMTNRIGEWIRFHRLALIACALFLLAGLAIVDNYGVSIDTGNQRHIALSTLNYVLHDDPGRLRVAVDRFTGAAFEAPLLLLTERVLGLEDPRHVYLARHVLTHLFFLIGGFCCYLLAFRLSGDRLIALLVMLLFLLSPRIYAHSFFNSKDPVAASAFVMALLFVCRAFDKDSVGAYRWCGAMAGLVVNLRILGIALFAIVLVFQAWAWFRAGGDAARRRVVAATGAFALWGIVVLFISLPYLWGDPTGRLAEMVEIMRDHPTVYLVLFRGQVFSGAALPWDYMLRWFAISQPPVTLLLGLLGLMALGLAARGVVRRGAGAGPGPGAAWGAAELRFGILLATCFALPLVAFALLRPTSLNDWRHFYFLHGPFCLLATFALMGLRQLSVRGLRKGWLGGAACALTAAGLGVVAAQMAQIHPHQYLYFNFFVDRKTPEQLRARYSMDYWNMAMRQGYELALRHAPSSPAINLKSLATPIGNPLQGLVRNVGILPATARARLTYDPARNPDFYLGGFALDDYFPPVLHQIKVYNNTIMTVATPDLSRVDAAVADEYRALLQAATAGEPVARESGYEVYRRGSQLAWVKEGCGPGELLRLFRLAFYPVDASLVSPHRQRQGNNVRLVYGARLDGKCLGAARLPEYAVSRVRLRQRSDKGGKLWETEFHL